MLGRLFGLKGAQGGDPEEGKKLFERGLHYFNNRECSKAIEYFSQSINACKNPAPYLARAQILINRIRYQEALQDLQQARQLDRLQGNEFSRQISAGISVAETVTLNYRNGVREKLIADYKSNDAEYVAERIIAESFNESADLLEYHFFNELDNVSQFDDLELYPEVAGYLGQYPAEFIRRKVQTCPDHDAYRVSELTMHGFLCSYSEEDMRRLRRRIIYDAHCKLMDADYGPLWRSIMSNNPGVTRDANDFINSNVE